MNIAGSLLRSEEKTVFKLRSLYRKFGYTRFRMNKFEEYGFYVENKNFLTSDNIITFTENGKLMALKPDVTLSIVKNSKKCENTVQKLYYDENVYRPSNNGFKEIMQVGLECIGDIDTYCKGEVLMLAAKSLGEISENYVLDLSHMGVVSAVLDLVPEISSFRGDVLVCLGEKNLHGLLEIFEKCGVPAERAKGIKALVSVYGEAKPCVEKLMSEFEGAESVMKELSELSNVVELLDDMGISVRIDFSVVHDMNYYSGIVFNGYVENVPVSVLSGGQYDHLVKKMGKSGGAIGFAVYPERVADVYREKDEYDIDTVILYDDESDMKALYSAMKLLTDSGKSVMAQKSIPEKLKYKQLLCLKERGVQIVEDNA